MQKSLRIWWGHYHRILLQTAVVCMTFISVLWLSYEFYRLLRQPERIGSHDVLDGGIDLKLRHWELTAWFDGKWVYHDMPERALWNELIFVEETSAESPEQREYHPAFYPPASYIMLWPFLGWLSSDAAIGVWALSSCLMLGGLSVLVLRESGAKSRLERLLLALLPLAMYASGATIGNGQLPLHLLPPLLGGLLLCDRKPAGWRRDILIAVMLLFSLTKPSFATPFFWILLFRPQGLRPAFLVMGGYLGLTYWASLFQHADAMTLLSAWVGGPTAVNNIVGPAAVAGNAVGNWTHANIHSLLSLLELGAYALYGSGILLAIQGIWTAWNRRADIWILMGVAGLTARFWMYHLWYDDLLILPAMIALFRIAGHGGAEDVYDVIAGMLFGCTLLVMMAPGGQYVLPQPWNTYFMTLQAGIWLSVLIFLLWYASAAKRTSHAGESLKRGTAFRGAVNS